MKTLLKTVRILDLFFIISLASFQSCQDTNVKPQCEINIPDASRPFNKLSEYSLFNEPINQLQPARGVLSYTLNTPLFSDYAIKARFLYVPEGKKILQKPDEAFEFPERSVLIKNFYYENDHDKNLVETRLLIRYSEGWVGLPYVWNENQTDALLSIGGADIILEHPLHQSEIFTYKVPNQNQCKGCHSLNNNLSPIGPKPGNLDKTIAIDGIQLNQLEYWYSAGILDKTINEGDVPTYAVWNDPATGTLEERARAYLDVNCGHCHRPEGPANNSGLNLYFRETNKSRLGFCKLPVSAGQGSGGFPYDIVPGDPDQSIMVYRMSSTDPRAKMPEIGRQLVHEEGVQLIRDWIASLNDNPCE